MKVTIRYTVINRKGQLVVKEKTFATEEKMALWCECENEKGTLVSVDAYHYGN